MLIDWQPHHSASAASTVLSPVCIKPPQTNSNTVPLTSRPDLKRVRPQSDVEGENSVDTQRKKRRLRVNLVTSRLSRPYATPATHIISSRKTKRLGPWARPRFRVRSPLRRAAILNAVQVRKTTARHIGRKEVNLLTTLRSHLESDHMEIDLVTEGIRPPSEQSPKGCLPQDYVPPSPSPLGPSNYDALDEEENHFDEDDMASDNEGDDVYSNFNELQATDNDIEDYDSLCPFGGGMEDYSRPWKDESIADDMSIETGKPPQIEKLKSLHCV
ncbi:MAG: hypothetical protein Q9178_005309 [Gyalolechia marmorata]